MINIFKKTARTRFLFFVISDMVLIISAVLLSFLIRFDWNVPANYSPFILKTAALAIIFIIPIFYFSKLYSFSWSYVSTNELISLFKAITLSFFFLGITIYISKDFPFFTNFPRSTLFISYFLVFIFCGAIRFAKRIWLQIFGLGLIKEKEKTLIAGAGDAGEQILRSILMSKKSPYLPVGFVDDNPIKQKTIIHGIKVLGKTNDIPKIVKNYQVKQLIIAFPSAGVSIIRKTVELGRKAGLKKIKIIPPITEIINSGISLKNLKEIEVEDLLGREPVDLELKEIEKFIKDKIILVTGAAGSIGSELSKQIARFKPSLLLLLDQDETGIFNISEELEDNFPSLKIQALVANIRDEQKIKAIFKEFKPNVVFHAAAYKHVPLMEKHPDEAVKNNIFGTKILAEINLDYGVEKFINISTDKAVNPTSVMGATKRVAEMICQALNQNAKTKFISVRFGNVLDSRGSVIPIFREQIKKGGPVEVTHSEMKRYFMLISEACLLVMQAGAIGRGGEVFILDMGEPIKILDLAKEMIKLSGFEPDKDIPIVFTGIRPGEKLFEDILIAEEGAVATKNEKIFTAKLNDINQENLNKQIKELERSLSAGKKEIVEHLKKIVPLYRP